MAKIGDKIPKSGYAAVVTGADGSKAIITPGEGTEGLTNFAKYTNKKGVSVYHDGKHLGTRGLESNQRPVDELPEKLQEQAKNPIPLEEATPIGEPVPVGETGQGVLDSVAGAVKEFDSSPEGGLVKDIGNTLANPVAAAGEGLAMGAKAAYSALNKTDPQPLTSPDLPAAKKAEESGSASLDMSMGGGIKLPGAQNFYNEEAEKKRIQGLINTEQVKADAQKELQRIYTDKAVAQSNFADNMAKSEQARIDTLSNYDGYINELRAEQSKLDPTIDPTRYWKDKNAGQIAMGAIAGALFGFAGKGMEYLQQVQHEVDRDVDAQRATYDNASRKMQQQLAAAGDAYARARERGLDSRAASIAAFDTKMQGVKSSLDAALASGASAEATARGQELSMGLDATLNMKKQEYTDNAAKRANEAARTELMRAQVQTQRMKVAMTGAKGTQASAADAKVIAAKERILNAAESMLGIVGASEGTKVVRKNMAFVPNLPGLNQVRIAGTSKEDADVAKDDVRVNREILTRYLTEAQLAGNDQERLLGLLDDPNKFGGANKRVLSGIIKNIRNDIKSYNEIRGLPSSNAPAADVDPSGFVGEE